MKLFLLLSGLLAAGAARGQELQGCFASTTTGWVADLLLFEGSRFTYIQRNCTGLVKGAGTFTVQPTALTLHFDGLGTPPPTLLPGCVGSPGVGGVYVQVRDQATGQPLPGAEVSLLRDLPGTSTSATGQAWLACAPGAADTLRVSLIGWAPQFIPLRPDATCFLVQLGHVTYLRAGTTYAFPLRSLHARSFTTSLRYRRISVTRARKMLAAWERLSAPQ